MKHKVWIYIVVGCLVVLFHSPVSYIEAQVPDSTKVFQIEWSPDGQFIAGAISHGLIIWDVNTDSLFKTFEMQTGVADLAWSPDSSKIAAADWDGTISIWNVGDELVITTLDQSSQTMIAVEWTNDGSRIIGLSFEDKIVIWDAYSYEPLVSVMSGGYDIELNSDNSVFVRGAFSGIALHDASTSELITIFEGDERGVLSVDWSPDDQKIVSGSVDNVRIWDALTGQIIMTLEGHTDYIRTVAWSPSRDQIISADNNNLMRVWDSNTGEVLSDITGITSVAAWSPDGNWIAYGKSGLEIGIIPTPGSAACAYNIAAEDSTALANAIVVANGSSTPQTICLFYGTYTLADQRPFGKFRDRTTYEPIAEPSNAP